MSDAIVHTLVRARIAEIAADAAACRAVRGRKPDVELAQSAQRRFGTKRPAGFTTHGALRDYLTAM